MPPKKKAKADSDETEVKAGKSKKGAEAKAKTEKRPRADPECEEPREAKTKKARRSAVKSEEAPDDDGPQTACRKWLISIFESVQSTVASHPKTVKKVVAYYNECQKPEFLDAMRCIIDNLVILKKSDHSDRCLKFLKLVSVNIDDTQLIAEMIAHALDWVKAKDNAIRSRSSEIVGLLMEGLKDDATGVSDSVLESLAEVMKAGLHDKYTATRQNSIAALTRIVDCNDQNDDLLQHFALLLASDLSKDVRCKVLLNLNASPFIIPLIIQCLEDSCAEIRKACLQYLKSYIPLSTLKDVQKIKVLVSLNDPDKSVRHATRDLLCDWLKQYDYKCERFLKDFGVEQHYEYMEGVGAFLVDFMDQRSREKVCSEMLPPPPRQPADVEAPEEAHDVFPPADAYYLVDWDAITSESAFIWRCKCSQLFNSAENVAAREMDREEAAYQLEAIRPELSSFAALLQRVYITYAQFHARKDMNDDRGRDSSAKSEICNPSSANFITKQMALSCKYFDYYDEIGRASLIQVVYDLITSATGAHPEGHVKELLVALGAVYSRDPRGFSDFICKVVAKLRFQTREDISSDHAIEHQVREKQEKLIELEQRKSYLKSVIASPNSNSAEKESATIEYSKVNKDLEDLNTFLDLDKILWRRTLCVIYHYMTQLKTERFLDERITRVMLHGVNHFEPEIQCSALRCVTIWCLLNKKVVLTHLSLFGRRLSSNIAEVVETSLMGIFDIFLMWNPEIIHREFDEVGKADKRDAKINQTYVQSSQNDDILSPRHNPQTSESTEESRINVLMSILWQYLAYGGWLKGRPIENDDDDIPATARLRLMAVSSIGFSRLMFTQHVVDQNILAQLFMNYIRNDIQYAIKHHRSSYLAAEALKGVDLNLTDYPANLKDKVDEYKTLVFEMEEVRTRKAKDPNILQHPTRTQRRRADQEEQMKPRTPDQQNHLNPLVNQQDLKDAVYAFLTSYCFTSISNMQIFLQSLFTSMKLVIKKSFIALPKEAQPDSTENGPLFFIALGEKEWFDTLSFGMSLIDVENLAGIAPKEKEEVKRTSEFHEQFVELMLSLLLTSAAPDAKCVLSLLRALCKACFYGVNLERLGYLYYLSQRVVDSFDNSTAVDQAMKKLRVVILNHAKLTRKRLGNEGEDESIFVKEDAVHWSEEMQSGYESRIGKFLADYAKFEDQFIPSVIEAYPPRPPKKRAERDRDQEAPKVAKPKGKAKKGRKEPQLSVVEMGDERSSQAASEAEPYVVSFRPPRTVPTPPRPAPNAIPAPSQGLRGSQVLLTVPKSESSEDERFLPAPSAKASQPVANTLESSDDELDIPCTRLSFGRKVAITQPSQTQVAYQHPKSSGFVLGSDEDDDDLPPAAHARTARRRGPSSSPNKA